MESLSINKPTGAGTITTYEGLARKARAFASGGYGLLIVAGGPGLAKSTMFRDALESAGGGYCWLEANTTPFAAYCKLWERRNLPVLIDDADVLHEEAAGKRLMKQFCDTTPWRRLSWESRSTQGDKAPAPPEFFTSSRVCVITNHWQFGLGDAHTAAIEDRGHCAVFNPTAREVHRFVAGWFWDQQVHDFVGQHLPYIRRPSCRLYTKTWEVKQAEDDWRSYVLDHLYAENDLEFHILQLLAEDSMSSNNARAAAFVRAGHGSRATFYRHLADLEQRRGLREIELLPVCGTPPTPGPDPMASPEQPVSLSHGLANALSGRGQSEPLQPGRAFMPAVSRRR